MSNKLNHVSGDFVAEFSKIMEDLQQDQKKIDDEYAIKIRKIVEMETARLEEVVPLPFEPGTQVRTHDGVIGKVLACPVEIDVLQDEVYIGIQYGPGKYFRIEKADDWEDVITCEGMIRKVTVEVPASEIEKDWGCDTNIHSYWPDDLEEVS